MQIVIDIPNWLYAAIMEHHEPVYAQSLGEAVRDGAPLPKGHGNIYDENDIKKDIENPYQCQTVLYGLELVKPIIEADKAYSEE